MKKIKYIVIILIVIIIIAIISIAISLFNIKSKVNSGEASHYNEVVNDAETQEMLRKRTTIHEVENMDDFFKVVNCVEQYLGMINKMHLQNLSGDAQKELENTMQLSIYNILSQEYIQNNDITKDNVYEYVDNINEKILFIPIKMNVVYSEDESTKRYIVYGIEENLQNQYLKDIYVIINTNESTNTFSVEPLLNNNYTDIEDISIENKPINIEKNDNNQIADLNITDEYISRKYLDYYKKLALGRPDIAYELLDEEYKSKRFGNLENYQNYIQENLNDFDVIQLKEYMVNRYDEYNQYVCKDKYGKLYIFEGQKPTNISIKLDTYTINTDEFIRQYENGSEQVKVQMNLNKFILMINNQDYQAAYNVLDDKFKNNYFTTIDDFKSYVQGKAYKYNNMQIKSFDITGNIYSSEVILTDLTGGEYEDETKGTGGSGYTFEWKFYMQLKEGTDFKLSFEV